ncbi:MAG TPA: hypothetical protein VNC41_14900, partial [Acidimicrobiia bacterium]|nr:hypothetical protein [Acidimicrobiia bacterium]
FATSAATQGPTLAVYGLMLVTGRMVLVPFVFAGLIATFRALFRSGHRVGPFAITLVLLAVQNLAAGILGGGSAAGSLHAAIALSAIIPAAILVAGWWTDPAASYTWVRREMRGVELWIVALALGYAAFVGLRWLTSPVPLGLAIPSLRNALTPSYALLVVLLLPPVLRPSVDDIGRWLIRWGVVVGVFGALEFLVLRDRFWVQIANVDALIDVKRLSTARIHSFQVPADFYTHFGHNYFRRLVSLYGDAITTSCYLALALLAVLVLWRRPRGLQIAALAVLVPAMMLGAVKGAFGVVAVGLLVATLVRSRFRALLPSGAVVVVVACAASVLFGWGMQFVPWNSSAGLHVDGIGSAVREVTSPLDGSFVMGDGVGAGGSGAVYANRVVDGHTPEARDVPGLDNGAGAILAQTGVLGLGLLLALFALVIDTTMRRSQESRGVLLAMAAVTALLCNFLMQEHALTLMTSLPFWMLGAVAVRATEPYAAATARFMPRMRRVRIDPVELDLATIAADVDSEVADVPDFAESAPSSSADAYTALTEPVAPTIHLVDRRRGPEQAEDDPELLDLMLADLAAAPEAFQPARATAQHFQSVISTLREGLTDFRRRSFVPRGGGGGALKVASAETLPAM